MLGGIEKFEAREEEKHPVRVLNVSLFLTLGSRHISSPRCAAGPGPN